MRRKAQRSATGTQRCLCHERTHRRWQRRPYPKSNLIQGLCFEQVRPINQPTRSRDQIRTLTLNPKPKSDHTTQGQPTACTTRTGRAHARSDLQRRCDRPCQQQQVKQCAAPCADRRWAGVRHPKTQRAIRYAAPPRSALPAEAPRTVRGRLQRPPLGMRPSSKSTTGNQICSAAAVGPASDRTSNGAQPLASTAAGQESVIQQNNERSDLQRRRNRPSQRQDLKRCAAPCVDRGWAGVRHPKVPEPGACARCVMCGRQHRVKGSWR